MRVSKQPGRILEVHRDEDAIILVERTLYTGATGARTRRWAEERVVVTLEELRKLCTEYLAKAGRP